MLGMTIPAERGEAPSHGDRSALLVTLAAMASLVVGMSISRFAYTPILPHMLQAGAIDHTEGALLASSNLLGYLVGALPAGAFYFRRHPATVLRAALVVNVLVLAVMLVTDNHLAWFAARFLSGVSSAFVFVFASTLVLALRRPRLTTAMFSSVGLGIAITGLLLPFCYRHWPAWQTGWLVSTILATVLASLAMLGVRSPRAILDIEDATVRAPEGSSGAYWTVCIAYGLAGFSYVVPATFLVTIMSLDPRLAAFAPASWTIVGVVAALSIFFWTPLAERFGKSSMLVASLLLLAFGCAAPAVFHNAFGAFGGAFGLGASFMAISMMSVGLVHEIEPERANTRIAGVTVVFSIGQFIGPLFTAYSYARTHGYAQALLVAAALLLLAAAIATVGLTGSWKTRKTIAS